MQAPDKHEHIYAGHGILEPGFKAETHDHTHFEALYVATGRLTISTLDKQLQARTGDVIIYPPGCAHHESVDSPQPCEFFAILFEHGLCTLPDCFTHDSSGRMRVLVQWLCQEQNSSYIHKHNAMEYLKTAFVGEFVKASLWRAEDPLTHTRSFMRDHLKEKLTLEQLAKITGMSKFHFVRKYRIAMGMTPMDDLQKIRIDAARELLATTDMPIKNIAAAAGIGNVYYFARVFRRFSCMSPGEFRRSLGRG